MIPLKFSNHANLKNLQQWILLVNRMACVQDWASDLAWLKRKNALVTHTWDIWPWNTFLILMKRVTVLKPTSVSCVFKSWVSDGNWPVFRQSPLWLLCPLPYHFQFHLVRSVECSTGNYVGLLWADPIHSWWANVRILLNTFFSRLPSSPSPFLGCTLWGIITVIQVSSCCPQLWKSFHRPDVNVNGIACQYGW